MVSSQTQNLDVGLACQARFFLHRGMFGAPQRGFSQPQRKITSTKMIRIEREKKTQFKSSPNVFKPNQTQAEHKLEYESQSQFFRTVSLYWTVRVIYLNINIIFLTSFVDWGFIYSSIIYILFIKLSEIKAKCIDLCQIR